MDKKLRPFERAGETQILPGLHIVVRLDGRGFTHLTKEKLDFDKPFDKRFSEHMIATTEHLMKCGIKIIYGYTQSDEISLLFHRDDATFGRSSAKVNSILAGEASAKLTTLLSDIAVFDCRIIQLPSLPLVVDYFRWRSEDAARNALNAHCYWLLRNNGDTAAGATQKIDKMSNADKNELLFEHGSNFNTLPSWQKRGVGLFYESQQKEGFNPLSGEPTLTKRSELTRNLELPARDAYDDFIRRILEKEYGAFSSA